MTALEKIKEIEKRTSTWIAAEPGSIIMLDDVENIRSGLTNQFSKDTSYLLRAFKVMREIAISQAECDQAAHNSTDSVEVEFEKRMKEGE